MGATNSKGGPVKNNNELFKNIIEDNKRISITADNTNIGDIKELNKDDFKDLTQVEELVLMGRNIAEIREGTFQDLKNLRLV
jgi:hypothetical protein